MVPATGFSCPVFPPERFTTSRDEAAASSDQVEFGVRRDISAN
jgi:hypothetical protein